MRTIFWIIILSALLGCKEDELAFNPSIHTATAEIVNLEAQRLSGDAYAVISYIPIESASTYINIVIEHDRGDEINSLETYMTLPIDASGHVPFVSIQQIDWVSADSLISAAFTRAIELDGIGEEWIIDEEAEESFVNIESNDGKEIRGTFRLHFRRSRPNPPDYFTRWPKRFSYLDGEFVAFIYKR